MTAADKRLARLERHLGIVAGPEPCCPHCGGEGFCGITMLRVADPADRAGRAGLTGAESSATPASPTAPSPAHASTHTPAHPRTIHGGCPACGRVRDVITYIFPLGPGDDPKSDPWDDL